MNKSAIFPALQLTKGALHLQVYANIRDLILKGDLKSGMKLPSSRNLSEMMSVSRNTIIHGLERLIDEGYLEARHGSGTFVAQSLPDQIFSGALPTTTMSPSTSVPELSNAIKVLLPRWQKYQQKSRIPKIFKVGVGCVDLFPHAIWSRILGRVSRHSHQSISTYNDVMGYLPLRKTLSHYLLTTRGVKSDASQIMIVNGTQQAINLTAQILLNQQDEIIIDDPGYDGAIGAFLSQGIQINPLQSDHEGMDIDYAEEHYPKTKLIYTTPSHHFPLGDTMSLTRRLQLLEFANNGQRWIFEDDYNGEFRYHQQSIQALQGLDQYDRVIYSGTFSKMFYPGFRMGYIVIPPSLIEAFKVAKNYADACNSYLEQAVLNVFIQEGEYAKHVRRVRRTSLERKNALYNALHKYLADILTISPSDSGIHSIAWIKNVDDYPLLMQANEMLNLGIQSLDRYRSIPSAQKALLLGFSAHPQELITEKIQSFAQAFRQLKSTCL